MTTAVQGVGPLALPSAWRARASELERYAPAAAEAFRTAAEELAVTLKEEEDALLSPAEAAAESGLSERRLRELRAAGALEDRGQGGRPRYRRGDLPRRAAKPAAAWSPDQDVSAIVRGRKRS